MLNFIRIFSLFCITLFCGLKAYSAPNVEDMSTAIKQANNPLAHVKAFNIQNYYYATLSNLNTTGDAVWLRYMQPIDHFLIRASLPIETFPVGVNGARQTGTSDFNIFAAYLVNTNNPEINFGIGPMLVAPTASPSLLGAGKWQGGIAIVYFDTRGARFQYGGLLTYQADFAGNKGRAHTSIAELQPVLIFQIGKGYYLRSAPIWTEDFISHTGVIPLGLGIGRVMRAGRTVYNLFIEPQVAVWHQGAAQPLTQVYAGLNMQFY